jgi:hypothetical protein
MKRFLYFFAWILSAHPLLTAQASLPAKVSGIYNYDCKNIKYPSEKLKLRILDGTLVQVKYNGAKEDQYFALGTSQPKGSLSFPLLFLGSGNTLKNGFRASKNFKDKVTFSNEEEGSEIVFKHRNAYTHFQCDGA